MFEKDPVCWMKVNPNDNEGTSLYQGRLYYFCSTHCKEAFDAHPTNYIDEKKVKARREAQQSPEMAHVEFTCPMDPEVVQFGPGVCPKCGMALEPKTFSLNTVEDHSELDDFKQRLWSATALTIPVVIAAMMMLHWRWFELLLTTPVVLWCGLPFLQRAVSSIRNRSPNMFTLIGLGVSVAYFFSAYAVLFMREDLPVYFESAAAIVTLTLLGQVMELRARSHTSSAIRALLDLAPKMAMKVNDNGTEGEVPISEIQVGDHVRVRPGEKIACDGLVIEGESAVDESMITGESLPMHKVPGAEVIGGTLNTAGTLVIEAKKVGEETMLAHIVKSVGDAQRSRAPIQKLADRVSAITLKPASFNF